MSSETEGSEETSEERGGMGALTEKRAGGKVRRAELRTLRVPRSRWGGKWLRPLEEVPADGEWHELAAYARTAGYQVARELNLAATLPPGRYEFGVVETQEGGSRLVVKRLDGEGDGDGDGVGAEAAVDGDAAVA